MSVSRLALLTTLLMAGSGALLHAQNDSTFKSIDLKNLDAFADPPKNWVLASDAVANLNKAQDLKPVKGDGAIVDVFTKNNRMHLYTKEEFADVQVELDFMMAKNSNSGVYLMGRYEVQLLDSWTRIHPASSDVGSVYSRWNAQRGSYEGTPPLVNVARAPGLWQHLSLKFRAPKFNDKGEKTDNARFDEVYLNGVLVQQMTSVTGPTASSMFTDEKAKGPLVLQGDHGPVALRNIRYRELAPASDSAVIPENEDTYWATRNPILLNPTDRPRLLRSFMNFGDKKLTHIISVGDPSQVNFSYDLKSGALFQVWRGPFLDVTRMWHDRGEPQRAVPLGSLITLSDAPSVAVLATGNEAWPDSIPFDDFKTLGYALNKKHWPSFSYSVKGMTVKDSTALLDSGQGISRTISISNAVPGTSVRIADAMVVENLGEDLFALNGKNYYIRVDKKYKPVIRQSAKGKELVVKYDTANPLTYSIIW